MAQDRDPLAKSLGHSQTVLEYTYFVYQEYSVQGPCTDMYCILLPIAGSYMGVQRVASKLQLYICTVHVCKYSCTGTVDCTSTVVQGGPGQIYSSLP